MGISVWPFFIAGLVALILGAELLVRGASRLAAAAGISPLVIGLTVVAFGTSSPELAVSLQSAWIGQADVAVGNAVGSNIFNVLFILGVSAAITPLLVAQQLVRWDVPLMIGASALLWVLALDGRLGRFDGLMLFSGLVAYTVLLIRQSRRESRTVAAEYAREFGAPPSKGARWGTDLLRIAGGLALLVMGARWLVDGAVEMARSFGVSELVIGLTLVAAGTSLPEVATSVVASLRGERDIAVGNVVGSNLFNILSVLGLGAIAAPGGLPVSPAALGFDIPVMTAVAVACLPIFFTGRVIARWEGFLFLVYYGAYTAYLILSVNGSVGLPLLRNVMLFVIPLTVLTLVVLVWRAWRRGGSG